MGKAYIRTEIEIAPGVFIINPPISITNVKITLES